MMKKLFLLVLIIQYVAFSQVGIGCATIHPSSMLQISNQTNGGLLLPNVLIDDLKNNQKPINNPVEGMLVYNKGGIQIEGYYIWTNNKWMLLADDYNKVTNLVLKRNTFLNALAGFNDNLYFNFNTSNLFTTFSNNIPGSFYNTSNNTITLPSGAYTISIELNISTPDENSNSVIGEKIHSHSYIGKLYNPITNTLLAPEVYNTALSNPSIKEHNITFNYGFKTENPIFIGFALAHEAASTYKNGLGCSSGTCDGNIIIKNMTIHIQRTVITNN